MNLGLIETVWIKNGVVISMQKVKKNLHKKMKKILFQDFTKESCVTNTEVNETMFEFCLGVFWYFKRIFTWTCLKYKGSYKNI